MRKKAPLLALTAFLILPCYGSDQITSVFDSLNEDVHTLILQEACDYVRDIPMAFTQMLVSTKWNHLLIKTTKTLDLKAYTDKSQQRHCTIMANMICTPSLYRFSEITTLSLDFHFESFWDMEFFHKLKYPEKRDFKTCGATGSLDGQITNYYKVLRSFENEAPTLFAMTKRPTLLELATAFQQGGENAVDAVNQAYEERRAIYDQRWQEYDTTYESLKTSYEKAYGAKKFDITDINAWLALHFCTSHFITSFNNLVKLNLVTWDQACLSFVAQLKNLKTLTLMGHSGHAFDENSIVYLDNLPPLNGDHPLEELTLTGRLYISSFQRWSKFPNLKNLTLSVKLFASDEQEDEERDKIMSPLQLKLLFDSLVENLPQLEKMGIMYRINPKIDIATPFAKLSKLSALTFKDSIVTNDDLTALSQLTSLQILDLQGVVDSSWPYWRAHQHLSRGKYFTALYEEEDEVIERFSPENLATFKMVRPDVKVLTKEEPQ